MAEAQLAKFKFRSYKIPRFSYIQPGTPDTIINLDFVPSGKYSSAKGIFELSLELNGYSDDKKDQKIINILCIASFYFKKETQFNEIPSYFYANSIAIVYPYIRAFLSTLTLQANSGLLLLEIMNLSNLGQVLIKNTITD